jgi:hypothetical protein
MTRPKRSGPPAGRIGELLQAALGAQPARPGRAADSLHPDGDRLFAYWEGGLDEAGREAVEAHVSACPRCLDRFLDVGELFLPDPR